MDLEREYRCKVEANLRLAADLEKRMALIRSVLGSRLFSHPIYSKPDLLNLWKRELTGFSCQLNGNFSFSTMTDVLEGEYHLRLSGGGLDSYRNEVLGVTNCDIRVRGVVSGFGPVNYELVPVSMIKTLDPNNLHDLQIRLTEIEFLLKTIGLLPDEEAVDTEEGTLEVIKIRRPKRVVREI